jgi:acyl-CoA oxidase
LITWNCGDIGNTCRERCGGGGFLKNNRLGDVLEGAHSGMTAEGDNRVLMQKVVKDIMTDI